MNFFCYYCKKRLKTKTTDANLKSNFIGEKNVLFLNGKNKRGLDIKLLFICQEIYYFS
jgi:hypothetical protein